MSTFTEVAPSQAPPSDVPLDLTIDLFSRMVESGLIPPDRRVLSPEREALREDGQDEGARFRRGRHQP